MKLILPVLLFLLVSPCAFAQTPEAPAKTTAAPAPEAPADPIAALDAAPAADLEKSPAPAPTAATVVPTQKVPPRLTVSISPIHLALPVGELMVEYNLNNKLGLAGILGVGQVTVEDAFGSDVTGDVFELGAQGNYYLWGDFRKGLHVGAEVMYLNAKMEQNSVKATGAGLSASAYVGYKHTFSFGLALILQLGYGATVVSAESEGESDSDSDGLFLINLNIGWTF